MVSFPLNAGGADVAVTKDNRQRYVELYLEWILNKSIYLAFRAFYHGFHSVCASNALLVSKTVLCCLLHHHTYNTIQCVHTT